MIRLAVFASGSGTNAENLIRYFSGSKRMTVNCILTNNEKAGVIQRGKDLNVPVRIYNRRQFLEGNDILKCLDEFNTDAVILAGFLLLVPVNILKRYEHRIINIHPALLPAHGGKGFYGHNVHKSVIDSGAVMSGITIHKVNDKFDDGEIIFQAACHVGKNETPESLAGKIHALEYSYFPVVVEKYLLSLN